MTYRLTLLPMLLASAWAGAAPPAQFDFGTADSANRAGFTRVTPADTFTAAKGYGFESADGLTALDRGGAQVKLPDDPHTASAYGASRTTTDLTCDLIEGQRDNAFMVALPDGDYTVWAIAGDPAEDPPLFEIWSGGRKQLDVRVPRARYVNVESFAARAVGGRLRIELKGPHGWLLNGLVIGPDGPELADVVAKLRRDVFFLTEPELPNWREAPAAPPRPPLAWTAAEQQRGYVVFPVDYTEPVAPGYVPARQAVGKPLTAIATPGEFEPATFCVMARGDLGAVAVDVASFSDGHRHTIGPQQVTIGTVLCVPKLISSDAGKGTYRVLPERIEPPVGEASHVGAGQLKQWWLTVHVPAGTPPGRYAMTLRLRPEKAPSSTLEWRLLVLPFTLQRPADRHWGTWLEYFPPFGGLRGPERRGRNTAAEKDRLSRTDIQDYREHGFDLAILGAYFGVEEDPNGGFRYSLGSLPQSLEYLKALGSAAPVVVFFEYTCRDLENRYAEPGGKHVPGTFTPKARQAIVGLVRFLRDEAQKRGWPPLYYYPIDEPGNNKTENRMMFAENVQSFVHEVPGCRTATTVGASDVQRLGDKVDVRIYAYGYYSRIKVIQEAAQGHPFWFYENGMFYGHNPLASRGEAGFTFLRSGAEVATAWGFDATHANPYNDFDGGHRDWNVIYPGVDRPQPTIYWELCREGIDDCRYVATLQERIRAAKGAAAQRAAKVLQPLLDPGGPGIDNPLAFGRYRWRVAREILSLSGSAGGALGFTAVAQHPPAADRLGPNLVQNPSFEDGPSEDGFPGGLYHIVDPYSKPEQRPVGALAVSTAEAHSGRYSLKWDCGQAAGKGSLYDGNRYLIVNVGIPAETARSLRGKRIRVGLWYRLEGGLLSPGFSLRQFGKEGFLGGIEYHGGVDDPAVWNHFEAEGRLRDDFDGLDIHTHVRVPDDPALAARSSFYIDDYALQAVDEAPLTVSSPLDEYYLGEGVPWTVTSVAAGRLMVELLAGNRVVARAEQQASGGALEGRFNPRGLKPGIYSLRATLAPPQAKPVTAGDQVILAPDPFAW